MRQETINIFKFNELSEDAKQKAIEEYRNNTLKHGDFHWISEIVDSLKGLFESFDSVHLTDYNLGSYNRNNRIKVSFDNEEAEDLRGKRALAYLENNLLNNIRISRQAYLMNRKDYLRFGNSYRVGKIEPCPFTGYCADDDFLSSLLKDIKKGFTLKESCLNLADKAAELIEAEEQSQLENDYISDTILANEYEFLQDGSQY